MSSPASLLHQDIVDFLVSVMRMFVASKDLGIVIIAPFRMKMEQGREPDVLFIGSEHQARLKPTYLDGPADLVVEATSPESTGRDRGEKFYEYERGGVPEYWPVDPLVQRVEWYQAEGGQYHIIPADAEHRYYSRVLPGFWLSLDGYGSHPCLIRWKFWEQLPV